MNMRLMVAIAVPIFVGSLASAQDFGQLNDQAEKVLWEFDKEGAEELLVELQEFIAQRPSNEANMALGKVALMVAELRRVEYETGDLDPRDNRLLGRTIDEVAEVGQEAMDTLPDTSEKWRIKSDLYGPMIRSKYKGNKYAGSMDKATQRALELDPKNPNAIVSGCRKELFAKPHQGGDVPTALEKLNAALEIDPNHERALVFRGMAYDKLGDTERAEADWKRALEVNPHSRLARENLNEVIEFEPQRVPSRK